MSAYGKVKKRETSRLGFLPLRLAGKDASPSSSRLLLPSEPEAAQPLDFEAALRSVLRVSGDGAGPEDALEAEISDGTAFLELDYVRRDDADELEQARLMLNDAITAWPPSYPFEEPMEMDGFSAYYLSDDAFVFRLVRGGVSTVVASVYVKPNYPGLCSHICNGGFLVARPFRRLGLATALARFFPFLGRDLGYSSSMFNLVFEENIASARLWRKLGYIEHGRIPAATHRAGKETMDALQFRFEFGTLPKTPYAPQ